jgi:hypothetical protein
MATVMVAASIDGVAISPPCGVSAFFQNIDILLYAFAPVKPPSLEGRNFCLTILRETIAPCHALKSTGARPTNRSWSIWPI